MSRSFFLRPDSSCPFLSLDPKFHLWRWNESVNDGIKAKAGKQPNGKNTSYTSNGGCRREEKSRKHWSLFTKLLSLVTANQEQLYVLIALKIREKKD